MVATVDFSTLPASPNGDGDKAGVQGNLVSPRSLGIPEAEVILQLLVTSAPTAEPLAFLAYYLEKIVYCFLGTGLPRSCLFMYSVKCFSPLKKNEPIYLTTTVCTFLCVVSLIEKSYLETDLSF